MALLVAVETVPMTLEWPTGLLLCKHPGNEFQIHHSLLKELNVVH
jgi:hypothetical protein